MKGTKKRLSHPVLRWLIRVFASECHLKLKADPEKRKEKRKQEIPSSGE